MKFYSFRKKKKIILKKKCLVAAKLKAEKIEARNFQFNKELKCTCFDNVCCCCSYMFRVFFFFSRLLKMFSLFVTLSTLHCFSIANECALKRVSRVRTLQLALSLSPLQPRNKHGGQQMQSCTVIYRTTGNIIIMIFELHANG